MKELGFPTVKKIPNSDNIVSFLSCGVTHRSPFAQQWFTMFQGQESTVTGVSIQKFETLPTVTFLNLHLSKPSMGLWCKWQRTSLPLCFLCQEGCFSLLHCPLWPWWPWFMDYQVPSDHGLHFTVPCWSILSSFLQQRCDNLSKQHEECGGKPCGKDC